MKIFAAVVVCVIITLMTSACEITAPETACDNFWMQAKAAKQPEEARELFEKAIFEAKRSSNSMQLPQILNDYSKQQLSTGNAEKAAELARLAMDEYRKLSARPDISSTQKNALRRELALSQVALADALAALNKDEEALGNYKSALDLFDNALGELTDKVEIMKRYGVLLRKLGRNEEASKIEWESDVSLTSRADCDRLRKKVLNALSAGNVAEARKDAQLVCAMAKKFSEGSNRYKDAIVTLGLCELAAGDIKKAKSYFLQAVDPKDYPEDRAFRSIAQEKVFLAVCYDCQGNSKEANPLYQAALQKDGDGCTDALSTVANNAMKGLQYPIAIIAGKRLIEYLPADHVHKRSLAYHTVTDALIASQKLEAVEPYLKGDLKVSEELADAGAFMSAICRLADWYIATQKLDTGYKFLLYTQIPKSFTGTDRDMVQSCIYCRLSNNRLLASDFACAESYARKSYELAKSCGNKASLCSAMSAIADSFKARKNFAEAEKWYQRAIADLENATKAPERDWYFDAMLRIADTYFQSNRLRDAKKWLLRNWTVLEQRPVISNPLRKREIAVRIAGTCGQLGEYAESEKWIKAAVEQSRIGGLNDKAFRSNCLYLSADAACGQHQFDKSHKLFAEELKLVEDNPKELSSVLPNSIARMANLADQCWAAKDRKEAVAAITDSIEAYKRHPEIKNQDLKRRYKLWVKMARDGGFSKEADQWQATLNSR